MLHAVIMAGGSGTRLWPLSRNHRPKQSLNLVGERSMFQQAVDRLLPRFQFNHIWIITRQEHAAALQKQTPEIPSDQFIIEPHGHGTAPAIGLAAIHLYRQDPEAVMVVLTADHFIADRQTFLDVLSVSEKLAEKGHLVTLGIDPGSPSSAYGYIEQGQALEEVDGFRVFRVRQFTEKPNRETAVRMVSSGLYSWNSGMFIWKVNRILEELHLQMPEFYEHLMQIDADLGLPAYPNTLAENWQKVEYQTIDYGIMERARDVVVVPVKMGWTDVGSWGSLIELLDPDSQGNIVRGQHLGVDTHSSLILGDKRLIATIGINDLVIIDTEDALLVCARSQEQHVKDLVEKLKQQGREELL